MRIILFISAIALLASCQSKQEKLREEISSSEKNLRVQLDSTKMLNMVLGNETYTKYIQYADNFKDDSTAEYLFKAADLAANGLRRPKDAIGIYERIRKDFPDYKKSAACLFMEAFLYETKLNDKEKAKEVYKKFIDTYPNHQLTASAQVSLDQLNSGMTDEELIRKFEAMQGK